MVSIRIEVTAEHIVAAGPWDPEDNSERVGHKDPVERAIAAVTGQDVTCDEDGPGLEIATIGAGVDTLVVNLPPEQAAWIDHYYRGETVEPFGFYLEIESWLVDLVEAAR